MRSKSATTPSISSFGSCSRSQFLHICDFGLLTEISGIEAIDEPTANLGEHRAGFVVSALLHEEARSGR